MKTAAALEGATDATTLEISGIASASGVIWVERELEAIDGVEGAVIDVTTGRARVVHDPARADGEAFVAAVRRAGFRARVHGADRPHPQQSGVGRS